MSFLFLWLAVLVAFFIGYGKFAAWYSNHRGFFDWWYSEIDRRPNAGHWYYRSKEKRVNRLRP